MVLRHNQYEAAFEAFLRNRQVPYVAVDEAKRSLAQDESLKSLDFIVTSSQGISWLVDVKGRRFPSGQKRRYWKNWSTEDDLVSLARWENLFGEGFEGLFVFAYRIMGDRSPVAVDHLFEFREELYGFVAVRRIAYATMARRISARWNTLAMPGRLFRQWAKPFDILV